MKSSLKRLVRSWVGNHPLFFDLVVSCSPSVKWRRINQKKILIIEGFPRCGNTFMKAVLQDAGLDWLRIVSHFHMPAPVLLGVKREIPTIVLVRHPKDCISSYVIRDGCSIDQALTEFVNYHQQIIPVLHNRALMIIDFGLMTSDVNSVIKQVKLRFKLPEADYVFDEEAEKRCFDEVEHMDCCDQGMGSVGETTVSRPSEYRAPMKAAVIGDLEQHPLYSFSIELYEQFKCVSNEDHTST